MLNVMHRLLGIAVVVFSAGLGLAQPAPQSFDVASVRPSGRIAGPDANNVIRYSAGRFSAHNATIKRLVAEAWRTQISLVQCPAWMAASEFDVEARAPEGATREQIAWMLRALLTDRFKLTEHSERRRMRIYQLTTAKGGLKVQPINAPEPAASGAGMHFHGDMRRFADLLGIQFSIPATQNPNVPSRAAGPPVPVIDKTGLDGTYDFTVEIRPELGSDAFTAWQRVLEDQLGLRIESSKDEVEVIVIDDATKFPTEN